MLVALRSLYHSVSSCARINKHKTDWFSVHSGLRQGCILLPLLLNIYINDLAIYLKSLDIGIEIGNYKNCILLYADDIILVAENEQNLQTLLSALNDWCSQNDVC